MDHARFEELMRNFQTQCSAENSIFDLTAFAGQPGAPIVVLVHGIGGNFRHWSDPIGMNPNDTWLFDINAHPPKGTNGVGTSPAYSSNAASSWTKILTDNNISYVTFSQAKPGDLIESAVKELVAILSSLEAQVFTPYEQDVAANGGTVPALIIVAHSRGGLVTRHALKQLGSAGLPHLRKVITLCTPHRGSFMPRLSNDYNNFLHNQIDFNILGNNLPGPIQGFVDKVLEKNLNQVANTVREAMLHSFGTMATSPGFSELEPGSPMFQGLEAGEQALPGVQYYGFGGFNPTFVNVYLCFLGQAVQLIATASPMLVGMLAKVAGVKSNYGGLAELELGDSAVALTSSVWPDQFNGPNKNFRINHMQALIDRPMQDAALQLIKA